MIGQRVKLAREACGLTQQELADSAQVSQSLLSHMETGRIIDPATESIEAIAEATGFPSTFFHSTSRLPDLPEGNYRKRVRGPVKAAKQLRAQTRQIVEIVERAEESLRLPPVAIRSVPQLGSLDEIEALVIEVRDWLGIGGDDPIPNLMRAVERSGVIVARLQARLEKHDSFCAWPDFGMPGVHRPIIVLTGGHPGDRDRFNVAHELGHLILHTARPNVTADEAEPEAHRFAGALLLPKGAARGALRGQVTLDTLKSMKATWGISMQAAAQRGFNLDLLTRTQLASIYKQLSVRRWRKNEPVDVPQEEPLLLPEILNALAGDGPSLQKAERIGMPLFTFNVMSRPPGVLRTPGQTSLSH